VGLHWAHPLWALQYQLIRQNPSFVNNITPATKEHQIIPVILCGGSGARLWPLSRVCFLKQFLVISDDGSHQSLFQQAINRIHSVANEGKITIDTSKPDGALRKWISSALLNQLGWKPRVQLEQGLVNAYAQMLTRAEFSVS
jgi:hypothetical protein